MKIYPHPILISGNPSLLTREIKKRAQRGKPLQNYGCSLQSVGVKKLSSGGTSWIFPFVLLTRYFICWCFTLVTFRRAHILISDRTRERWKQLRCIPNIHRLTEEDSIFWFDLCGWIPTIPGKFWVGLSLDRNPVSGITDYCHCHQMFLHWRLTVLIAD